MQHRQVRDICDVAFQLTGGRRWAWYVAFVGLALNNWVSFSRARWLQIKLSAELLYKRQSWGFIAMPPRSLSRRYVKGPNQVSCGPPL